MTDYKALYEQSQKENAELKKHNEEIAIDKDDFRRWFQALEMNIMKLKEEKEEMKLHFNLIIELIKGCKTKEQLQKLKELKTLN